MTQRQTNIFVGSMALSALISLGAIMFAFGYLPTWLEKNYTLSIQLNHASGLWQGSQIKLSGIPIGQVSSVQLQQAPKRGVLVSAAIKLGTRIPQQAKISVQAPIIGGSPTLTFLVDHLDDQQMNVFLPTDGSAMVTARVPSLATQFAEELKAAFAQPLEQFSTLTQNLNLLVEPTTPGQVDQGVRQGNVSSVLARADTSLKQLHSVLGQLDELVNDPAFLADIRTTASNAAKLTGSIQATAGKIDQLAGTAGQHLGKLAARYVAVADHLSQTIASVQTAVDQLIQGQGTAGQLLTNPALYNNLNDAMIRINKAISELQLLLTKWKKEGVPIRL